MIRPHKMDVYEDDIKDFFVAKYNFKQEISVGNRKRVDLGLFNEKGELICIAEVKINDFSSAIGQILYYEFLLGKSVEKKIVLSYYEFKESCHGDAVKNKKKIKDKKDALLNNLRFFMKIKKELGIDFLFYVPFREEYVKLEDCYKFFDQGDIEEDIDFDQFFWKKG